jgi:hypothetical protein
MPGAIGPEDRRIVGKVWPLELIARESDEATTRSIRPFPNSGSICAIRTFRAGNPIRHSNFW